MVVLRWEWRPRVSGGKQQYSAGQETISSRAAWDERHFWARTNLNVGPARSLTYGTAYDWGQSRCVGAMAMCPLSIGCRLQHKSPSQCSCSTVSWALQMIYRATILNCTPSCIHFLCVAIGGRRLQAVLSTGQGIAAFTCLIMIRVQVTVAE